MLNIGHPSASDKRQAVSQQRATRASLLAEWEKQKKVKQMQHKIQTDLNVLVTEERLPQAIVHTQNELRNMLTAQPLNETSQYYEQALGLGAALATPGATVGSPRGLVSSRERLRVKDVITAAAPAKPSGKKGSVGGGGISHDSTQPHSAAKPGGKPQLA